MKKLKRQRFTSEYKVECASLVLDQGYRIEEASDLMHVGKSTLGKWVRKLRDERIGEVKTGHPISAEHRKIAALEKQIKQLELEKEILKKASALLMSDSMKGLR